MLDIARGYLWFGQKVLGSDIGLLAFDDPSRVANVPKLVASKGGFGSGSAVANVGGSEAAYATGTSEEGGSSENANASDSAVMAE
jgi:hypothetical protein